MEEKKKLYIIYKTTCSVNNKIYIGQHQTYNLEDGYLGSGLMLVEDIKKLGRDKFSREILFFCENAEELNNKEKQIVDAPFVSREDTYNLACGGGNHDNIGALGGIKYGIRFKEDKEFREKMQERISKSIKDWYENLSDDEYAQWSQKISQSLKKRFAEFGGTFTGKKHKEETKRKIGEKNSISQKGKKNSQFATRWIFNRKLKKSKKIKITDIIPDGWELGRVIKFK